MLFPPEQTATTVDKEHGRIETRTLSVLTLHPGQVAFPFASQIFSIERTITDISSNTTTKETAFGITSLTDAQAGPDRILALNRGHWIIENGVHYVRDVTMSEDRSRIRTKNGPRAMAILRNLTLNVLRRAGVLNIAKTLREFVYNKLYLFSFMGMNHPLK